MASTLEPPVMIPNGDSIPVEGKGNCHLPNGTTIKEDLHSRELIGMGKCKRGLYWIEMVENKRKAMMDSVEVWHKRLGHTSSDKLSGLDFVKNASFKTMDCDSCDHLVDFHKLVKTQFGKLIKRIRCDNGGEFVSNRMSDFYTEQGIILETTCPHMPQQNGVVERKHMHLLETARALRFEANLPKRFWGECVLTAAYIINRLPSKTIDNKTPFEILYGKNTKYEHMKVFGCLAYFRNTDTKGDKFE
ncbi:retrovirus-related pol polyprotein from transposon TNT 1-94 [Tanacetum coccineum]